MTQAGTLRQLSQGDFHELAVTAVTQCQLFQWRLFGIPVTQEIGGDVERF